MDNLVTCDLILNFLKEQVENKIPVAPSLWLDAAQKLTILSQDENEKLFELQQKVAQEKVDYITKGDSVAKAKAKIEASDTYKFMQMQKAKIERIAESIRISKYQARMNDESLRGWK